MLPNLLTARARVLGEPAFADLPAYLPATLLLGRSEEFNSSKRGGRYPIFNQASGGLTLSSS